MVDFLEQQLREIIVWKTNISYKEFHFYTQHGTQVFFVLELRSICFYCHNLHMQTLLYGPLNN